MYKWMYCSPFPIHLNLDLFFIKLYFVSVHNSQSKQKVAIALQQRSTRASKYFPVWINTVIHPSSDVTVCLSLDERYTWSMNTCMLYVLLSTFQCNLYLAHFRDGERTGPSAVVGIKRLWCQNPLAPANVSKVYPEVPPGANPWLAPLSPPGLLHCPLVKAQHLRLTQALAVLLTQLPSWFHRRFGFSWEIRVLPQFVILQGVVLDFWDVICLDLEMKLPPDPRGWGWGGRIISNWEGPVPLEWHSHAVWLIYSLIVSIHQNIRQVGWREALLCVRAPLLRPSRPELYIKLHRYHKSFDISGMFHHRRYIPRLPRTFLERSQSYVSQWCCKSWIWGWSMEEELLGGRMRMVEAGRRVAGPS